jgi:hypothetical protein
MRWTKTNIQYFFMAAKLAARMTGAVIATKTNFSIIPLVFSRGFQLVVRESDANLLQ